MGRLLISLLVFAAALARPAWPAPKNPADLTKPPTARPKSADPPRRGRSRRDTARRIARINRQLTALFEQKKYEQCEALLKEALKLDPDNGITWYNLACVHSRTGRKDRAVEALDTAVAHGYSGFRHMERDPDLDAIRKMPGYRKIIARRDEIHRERAEKIRDRLRKEFGEGYLVGVDHERKLVFATNVDRRTLDEMKQRLTTYATAQWADLFTHGFERYLTVVVPRSSDWPSERMGGFYARQTHTLYARNVGMTLVHEFTHALHAADQDGFGQHHPIWVTEGLATLFETSRVADGHAMPRVNRRLNLLQHLVRRKRTAPLKELLNYSHGEFMDNASTAYAQGRYVMMYLHRKGLLKKWYDTYVDTYDDDRSGAKALEKVLNKKLPAIEADWKQWVLSLAPAVVRLPPKHAYIGIQLRSAIDGVAIESVVRGSGAQKAGLIPGDVIVKLDDERTIDPEHLMTIINGHEVGDKVKVRYRRAGKYRMVTVTLGAMPTRIPSSRSAPYRRPAPRPRPAPPKPKKTETKRATTKPATQPAKKKAA